MSQGRLEGYPVQTVVNAMTVDVEDWFQVQAFAGVISRESWSSREYRVVANTQRVLCLFAEHGVRATFFVLGWVAERSPELVREIQAAGHEIGCHGWSHQLVYTQAPADFREETIRAKAVIEDAIGVGVYGYRAATYSITKSSLWALDTLVDLGFKYDSSIFPVRHDTYGIPDAPRQPCVLVTPSGRHIVEFPLTTWQVGPLRIPVAGGGYFRLLPYALIREGIKASNRKGLPAVFYMHPWEVDATQPRVNASLLSRLRHYSGLGGMTKSLARLCTEFHFGTMAEVLVERGVMQEIRSVSA